MKAAHVVHLADCHQLHEVFHVDEALLFEVTDSNHFFELLLCHINFQSLSGIRQIHVLYLTVVIVIVRLEGLLDLGNLVSGLELCGHKWHKLVQLNGSTAVPVGFVHQVFNLLHIREDAEHLQGLTEFANVHSA